MIKLILMLKKHSSLVVMGLGALSIFIANIGLKQVLTDGQYYDYSIFVTILTLLTSFGALGIDQVLLRLSTVENKNKIILDKKIVYIAIFNTVIMSLVAYFYLAHIIKINENDLIIFVCCLCAIWIMLFYNVLRLASYFLVSQLIQNSWKIFFGIFSVIIFFNRSYYDSIFFIITILMIILVFFSILFIKENIVLRQTNLNSKKEIFSFSFHFFLALLTLSFLSQGDRIFVDRMFTESEFGDYFYLATLFLFPFSLFQSYIGFKELVYIKTKNINIMAKLSAIFKGSLIFTAFLFGIIFGLSKLKIIEIDIEKNIWLIVIFLIIGNIKMLYSLFSALIGVKATLRDIKKMNIIFISVVLILFLSTISYINNIEGLLLVFCILWFIRLIIWWYFSKTHISDET